MSAKDAKREAKSELLKIALEAYQSEYGEKFALCESLERKAQGTIAIAGIMLAGGFAFAQQLNSYSLDFSTFLLLAVILTLLFSIWRCVQALRIRQVDSPQGADAINQHVSDALQSDDRDEFPNLVNGIRYDQLEIWTKSNKSISREYSVKARYVANSQTAILVAAILIAVVTGIHVMPEKNDLATNDRSRHEQVRNTGVPEQRDTARHEMPGPHDAQQWSGTPPYRLQKEPEADYRPYRQRQGVHRGLDSEHDFRPIGYSK